MVNTGLFEIITMHLCVCHCSLLCAWKTLWICLNFHEKLEFLQWILCTNSKWDKNVGLHWNCLTLKAIYVKCSHYTYFLGHNSFWLRNSCSGSTWKNSSCDFKLFSCKIKMCFSNLSIRVLKTILWEFSLWAFQTMVIFIIGWS